MWEYKTETLTKNQMLMTNGIFTVERDKKHFIQYNDYFEHATFFQCPKCKSLNNESEKAFGDNVPAIIVRLCEDCGYKHSVNLCKEDDE
jgi:translation initiation factor 2 beta subunit (eIF-2beta)/eIF-5